MPKRKHDCLSKRWRDLWKHATCLNVDDVHALHKPQQKKKKKSRRQQVEATSSINWVHQVLQLHQGSTLEELKIRLSSPDYSENSFTKYTSELDNWFAFAVAKKVQKVVINMKGARCWPANFADPEKPFKSLLGISCIKSLRHLCLTFVYISGDLVEHFLSCCPLLEHLCISGSEDYMNLKVSGSSLRLKSLRVSE